ncbi:beta-phosphoglucomutase [Salinimicrobium marinum]|uniref:Beta-phosphoglucomutase n=1 Tax=Salinimicrobium marinum TaxID=680283 RepID=A0A918VWB2_9FLAO|nr:beta-phosphoglucomutase [Salinimicrobium marinum]GHA29508.1 beta-phosphoglucomutase [Salinimicrobium marinum]
MNQQSKGIIFDLDGVIVDTAKFHFLAWRKMSNNLGFDITQEQNEDLKGVSRVLSLQRILKWGNKTVSEEDFQRLMTEKNEDYLSQISSMSENDLLPGMGKILDYLTQNNIPFALGSASKNARPILKSLKIYDRFAAIVDGNDVTKAKPDPEVFLIAAEKLNMKPEDCIVFEDALAGIEAANTARMISIGIGDKNVLQDADYNFADSTEIEIEFLEKLVRK